MQGDFFRDQQIVNHLKSTLGTSRLSRYLRHADNDLKTAIELYHYNTKLSECFYVPLQMWEIALRNRLSGFLAWKYKKEWVYEDRLLRNLNNTDRVRLNEAIGRQKRQRQVTRIPTDPIVADLSAGFWVSLFTKGYDVPFQWRHNLRLVFPHDNRLDRETVSTISDGLLKIRNRVAHHEPILDLDLISKWREIDRMLAAMCPGSVAYVRRHCSFTEIPRPR